MPILALEAENLVKAYRGGGRAAVDGISFAVAPGMVFGLLGPNGSGKSTAVRVLVTLLKPTSGTARVCGFDVARQPERVRRVIGYAGQSTGIDDDLTAAENAAFHGMLHGLPHNEAWRRGAEVLAAAVLVPVTVASFRSIKELSRMPAIEVRGLTKRFGAVAAVDDLSFSVRQGTVTAFLGPNGAGKTTTLRMLLGLVKPSAGSATVNGRPYREVRGSVGASLEAAGFHPGRTGRGHLRARALARGADGSSIDDLLAMVDLAGSAGSRIGTYSLGMRQRLGLAAAMIGDPRVLILDEPANGLDPEGVRWLRGFLRGLAAEGRTILVSSHLLGEVAQTADQVVIIDRGRLVTAGPITDLTRENATLEDLFLSLTGKEGTR